MCLKFKTLFFQIVFLSHEEKEPLCQGKVEAAGWPSRWNKIVVSIKGQQSVFQTLQPTLQNPLPTLNMGFAEADKRVKRMIQFDATNPRKVSPRVKVKVACPEPELGTASPLHACDPEVDTLTKTPFSFPWILTVLTIVFGLCIKVYAQNKTIARLTAEILILKEATQN